MFGFLAFLLGLLLVGLGTTSSGGRQAGSSSVHSSSSVQSSSSNSSSSVHSSSSVSGSSSASSSSVSSSGGPPISSNPVIFTVDGSRVRLHDEIVVRRGQTVRLPRASVVRVDGRRVARVWRVDVDRGAHRLKLVEHPRPGAEILGDLPLTVR